MAALSFDEAGFDDAQVHVEKAKLRALDSPFPLGHAVHLQALIWYRRRRLQDAASEALHAQKIFEKLGNSRLVEICKKLLKDIKGETEGPPASVKSGSKCGLLRIIVYLAPVDSPFLAHGAAPHNAVPVSSG